MIVIESGALITIAVAFVSSAVSVAATWYFARRKFGETSRKSSEDSVMGHVLKYGLGRNLFYLLILIVFSVTLLVILLTVFVFNKLAIEQVA